MRAMIEYAMRSGLALALALFAAACDGGDPTGPAPVPGVSSVRVAPKDGVWTGTLNVGQTVELKAKAIAANGAELPDGPPAWTSSDTTVAVVTAAGVVVARRVGSAEIRASISGRTGRVSVVVTADPAPPQVAEVRVTPAAAVLEVGQTRQYAARAFDANGGEIFGRDVTWSTTTPQTITVGLTGIVQAVGAGYGEVRATVEGRTGAVALTVTAPEPVRAVFVNPPVAAVFTTQYVQLQATVLGQGNGPLHGRQVTWTSENPAVAMVGINGNVLGVTKGTARIRATSEGVSGWATIEVRNLPTSSQPTYDLIGTANLPTGYVQIGESTWTDPGGNVRDVFLIVRAAGSTLQLDLTAGKYLQTFVVEYYLQNGAPNSPPVFTTSVVDRGNFYYDFQTGLTILESTATPGTIHRAAASGVGELMIPQSVMGTASQPWIWVIR